MKFGYLPESDLETGELRSENELRRAVKSMQEFAGMEATGELDDRTIEMMQRPRCGNRDVIQKHRRAKRYVLGPSKWDKRYLKWRILNYSPDMPTGEVRRAVHDAFKIWSDVTELTFVEVMHGAADLYIRFADGYHSDGYPFDGPGGVLAHAFFPGEDKGGDVHFDDGEKWTYYSATGTNLYSVAAHEIGHALGLAHSRVPGSLMYPWYQGYKTDLRLHYDDIAGIQYLYGGKARRPFVSPSPPAPRTRNPEVTTRWQPKPVEPTTSTTTSRRVATEAPTVTYEVPKPTPSVGTLSPGDCTATFDATAVIRKELFIFKGPYFWRVNETGPMPGYPLEIHRFWYKFPQEVDHIDAVYERPGDGKIVFFVGKRYWLFEANYPEARWPSKGRPITELGLPADIEKVDAAFVWGHNKKTYFFCGDMYWRYNERHGSMDYGYPRDIGVWSGVKAPVDAAMQYWDKKTYFFHGTGYYQFNDGKMEIRPGYPQPASKSWLRCTVAGVKTAKSVDTKETIVASASTASLSLVHFLLSLYSAISYLIR